MKTNSIFSRLLGLMLMAAAVTTFTACSNDDDKNDSQAKQYDDLEYFQKAICNIDANGAVHIRTAGEAVPANTWTWISGTYITS